jgi:integrase
MVRTKIAATVEAVTRRVAGRYVSDELIPSGRDPVTLGKSVRSLMSYWAWLQKRGRLPEEARNPWSGQAPQKRANDFNLGDERAFTDGEVARLLASSPSDTLAEFMLVGALTGMRREEIGQLQVADCADGVFIVTRGETAASRRRVPIHQDLIDIVNRRSRGKQPATHDGPLQAGPVRGVSCSSQTTTHFFSPPRSHVGVPAATRRRD